VKSEQAYVDYLFISREYIEQVLQAYCNGVSICDISAWVGISEKEVNSIIGRYADLFLEGPE